MHQEDIIFYLQRAREGDEKAVDTPQPMKSNKILKVEMRRQP
jgi:hypothetical protein